MILGPDGRPAASRHVANFLDLLHEAQRRQVRRAIDHLREWLVAELRRSVGVDHLPVRGAAIGDTIAVRLPARYRKAVG